LHPALIRATMRTHVECNGDRITQGGTQMTTSGAGEAAQGSGVADDLPETEDVAAYYFGTSQTAIPVRHDRTPYDRQFVPEWDDGYEIDEPLFEKLAVCVSLDLPVLVSGPRGTGKSSGVVALAAAVRQPLRRINLNANTRTRDLIGYRTLDYEEVEVAQADGSSRTEIQQVVRWVDGLLPDAMKHNHWLLIDEFDAASPGVLMALQAVLEPARRLVLAENGGEVVAPPGRDPRERRDGGGRYEEHEYRRFRVFATANTLGHGDDTGFYAGTNVMNAATMDRFVVIQLDYPKPEAEVEIIRARTGVPARLAKTLVGFAKKTRDAFDASECGAAVSTRQLIAWCEILVAMAGGAAGLEARGSEPLVCHAMRLSYAMAVGDKLAEDDVDYYAGVFQRDFGFTVTA